MTGMSLETARQELARIQQELHVTGGLKITSDDGRNFKLQYTREWRGLETGEPGEMFDWLKRGKPPLAVLLPDTRQ